MTNWEINYEKIGKEADKIYKNNQPYSYARAFIEAILKVADIQGYNRQVTVLKSIDWLTQEAKPKCETCFYKNLTCKNRTDCTVNGYRHWKPAQEAESNHIGESNEMVEPQQSKARFIKTISGKLLNTSQIVDIVKSEINETQTVVIDVNNDVRFIQKPINEVIQQLGIEVIYE